MDFKQIDAFVNVAKYKSFSRAAEAIYLSQPTISAHISTLEKELNLILFDRNGKEIKLTTAGEIFLEYAINLTNIRNTAIINLSNYDNNIAGKLHIASSTTPTRFLVPGYIQNFSKEYKDVSFDIKESSTKNVIDLIITGSADIGFVGEKIDDERLTFKQVAEDNLIIISGNDNLPETLTLEEVLAEKFILREKGSSTRNYFEKALLEAGYPLSRIDSFCEVNSLDTVLQFVKAGIGISMVSELSCIDYLNSGFLKKHTISDISITRQIYSVTHNKHTLSPAAKEFLNMIK